MNIVDFFENDLPILDIDVKNADIDYEKKRVAIHIRANIFQSYTGTIELKNIGGGILSGNIYGEKSISFDQTEFNTNITIINYTINLSKNKEMIEASISSTGGEFFLRFYIEITSPVLMIGEYSIHNLSNFYEYFLKNSNLAKKNFIKHEFLLWLMAIDYKYIDIYEQMRSDLNKERGINNFFIFNNLKEHAKIILDSDQISINVNPFKYDVYTGYVTLKLIGNGYVDQSLISTSRFIKLDKEHITATDFKDNDSLQIGFSIDKNYLENNINFAKIKLTQCENTVNIKVKQILPVEINLKNNYCSLKEDLELYLCNNTNKPIKFEIEPRDSFVKLDKQTYLLDAIDSRISIPVYIRLSKLMLAQKSMKKRHVFTSVLRITTHFPDKKVFNDLKITVGDFK